MLLPLSVLLLGVLLPLGVLLLGVSMEPDGLTKDQTPPTPCP